MKYFGMALMVVVAVAVFGFNIVTGDDRSNDPDKIVKEIAEGYITPNIHQAIKYLSNTNKVNIANAMKKNVNDSGTMIYAEYIINNHYRSHDLRTIGLYAKVRGYSKPLESATKYEVMVSYLTKSYIPDDMKIVLIKNAEGIWEYDCEPSVNK